MSETAKSLFDSLKASAEARLNAVGPEISSELGRLGRQGVNELASALFTGNSFVLYGSGQKASEPQLDATKADDATITNDCGREGRD